MELEYNRSLHDKEHVAGPFEVTEEMIRDFVSSVGESNPVFVDEATALKAGYRGLVAPPTFCSVLVHRVSFPDIKLKFGRTQMHAGQRVKPKAPVIAGDSVTVSARLKKVYPKTGRSGTMVFTVWETTFRNQDGEVVAEIQESMAARE